jgi:very-short-patch-repair endonuclease
MAAIADVADFIHQIAEPEQPRAREMRTNRGKPGADRVIAELAARQHGVVARRQLFAAGLSRGAVDRRLATGRLHAPHPAVYAVGQPRIAGPGRLLAAVLACGDEALLSHRSAAALWELLPYAGSRVNVTAPSCGRRSLRGITLHRSRCLDSQCRAIPDGIPLTSVARTLLDLAGTVRLDQLERAFEQAERLRLVDLGALTRLCERSHGHHGLRRLLPLLAPAERPAPETRSELERRFLRLCEKSGLPGPAVNAEVAGHEVDALWRDRGLVVELDGYAYHRTRAAFERDRVRDADLQRAGLRVIRVTARRLNDDPVAVAETVRSLLEVLEPAPRSDVAEGRAP